MILKFKTFNYCLYKTTETKLLFRKVQTVMDSILLTLSPTSFFTCAYLSACLWCVCLLTCHMYTKITFVQTVLFLSNFASVILMKAAYQHNNYFFLTVTYNTSILFVVCFLGVTTPLVVFSTAPRSGLWPPHSRGSLITHNDAPQSVGLLWASDQSVAETCTWRHTTLTTDKHLCPLWDSNLQSQRTSGRRPMP